MKLELAIMRKLDDPDMLEISVHDPNTGETREVWALSVESGMRRLGRTIDRDLRLAEEHKRFLDTNG